MLCVASEGPPVSEPGVGARAGYSRSPRGAPCRVTEPVSPLRRHGGASCRCRRTLGRPRPRAVLCPQGNTAAHPGAAPCPTLSPSRGATRGQSAARQRRPTAAARRGWRGRDGTGARRTWLHGGSRASLAAVAGPRGAGRWRPLDRGVPRRCSGLSLTSLPPGPRATPQGPQGCFAGIQEAPKPLGGACPHSFPPCGGAVLPAGPNRFLQGSHSSVSLVAGALGDLAAPHCFPGG